MRANVWARWVPRLVLAAFAGGVPAFVTLSPSLEGAPAHTIELSMAADTGGRLQVFYDRGKGFNETESATVRFGPSDTSQVLRAPLPFGTYYHLRIDPNTTPGRYVFSGMRILDGSGAVRVQVPLDTIRQTDQVHLEFQPGAGLAVVTNPDADDPWIVYSPAQPLILAPAEPDLPLALGWGGGLALVVLVLTALLDRTPGMTAGLAQVAAFVGRRPSAAAVLAGLIGALAASYPLLLGHSAVTPANGPTFLMYDQPPYTFGSTDRDSEATRGTDVGAMMWAILPYTVVQREALAHGEFPLWNRYNAIGEPLWGQGQTFILDPFHLASLAIPDPAVAMDLRFVAGRAVFAIGTGLTVAAVTGHGLAAVIAALVAPFVGHFTARFNHPAFFSIVYAPWILFAYARLSRVAAARDRFRAGAFLAIASFLQFVGSTPKEGIIALVAAHVAGVTGLFAGPGAWRPRVRRVEAALLGGVVATLLAAPHWLVFLDTLSRSYTLYGTPQARIAAWPELVAYVLGGATPDVPMTGVHPLVVLAAVAAVAAYPRRLVTSGVGLGASLAVCVIGGVAFGAVPPDLLLRLPLVANIHSVASTFLGATVAPLLVVAGVGLAGALDETHYGAPRRLALVAALTMAGLVSMVPGGPLGAGLLGALAVVGASIALVMMGWPLSGRPSPSLVLAAACSVAAAVLVGGLHLPTGVAAADALLIQPRPRADLDAPSPALRSLPRGDPYRVAPVDEVLFPGTQAYWGVEGIGGPDALRLPEIEALLDAAGLERTDWGWQTILHPEDAERAGPLLDMLNVGFLVARPDQVPPGLTPRSPGTPDLLQVIERPGAWPRAFVTEGVDRHRGVTELAGRVRGSAGPFSSVDEQDVSAVEAVRTLPRTGAVTPATRYTLTPNSTSFHVETAHPGIAILAEAFVEKDFQARLNGRNVPYFRVNHAFKGVFIPGPGSWHVVFEYRPDRWRLSWLLNALGMTGLALMVLAAPLLKSSANRQ